MCRGAGCRCLAACLAPRALAECPCRGPVPAEVHVPFADVAQMRLLPMP